MSKPSPPFLFGEKPLIVFLAFLNAFVPLSIDLYLPALPGMARLFTSSDSTAKLTLSLFMLTFALSMLIWGPLSDKYGRKSILRIGILLYIAASLFCALAQSMEQLITGRILEAIGCGAVQSVSMAIVKDIFREGRIMENVLVWIQSITILCPLIAPVLGAFLLQYLPWRGLFYVLAGGALIGLAFSFALRETLENALDTSPFRSLSRIGFVLKNKGFRLLLIVFSIIVMPFMAYLSSSAFIYQNLFGLSSMQYSYFFAANAVFAMLGPLAYVRLFRRLPNPLFLNINFGVISCAGLLILFLGHLNPWLFALLFIPITFMGSANRPLSAMLMMNQLDSDNGSVVALMSCTALLFGSFSMLICSMEWTSLVHAVGLIGTIGGGTSLALWIYISKNKIFREPGRE
ncbi:MAG: MFS transporter [Burkholderiaceae bacterium]|jgi:DHA1 family bicyclomycin/chloramphenicol resistance-like MFS transporter|nr:MFS transporter [Burkholderiaceae bacterium]